MTFHSRCAASAAERWMNCAGSINLAEKLGRAAPAPYLAAEGTVAHSIAAERWSSGLPPQAALGSVHTVDGHEITCDQEMVDGVALYLDTLREIKLERAYSELPLHAAMQRLDPDLGGTADFATYSPTAKLLRVVDFKYGAGTFVSADDNKQLKLYALGALCQLNVPAETVEIYIVQPRYEGVEPVRMVSFPAWELMEFAAEAISAARATRSPLAPLTAGPWCKKTFCPNAAHCPALEEMQHALVKAQFTEVAQYDPDHLASMLKAIPLVEERIKALREFAYAELLGGRAVPGYKLVEKRPRRVWTDNDGVVSWAEQRAVEPYEAPALKSPAQLEKGLKKAEKEELKQFYTSVSSGMTMAPESDPRPAVGRTVTADDFPAIGGPDEAESISTENLFK